MAGVADAVVVGSAVVKRVAEHADQSEKINTAVAGLLAGMRAAMTESLKADAAGKAPVLVTGGAGYIDAEWSDGTISPITGRDLSGVQPPNVARWSGSAALEYEGDIGANEFFVRGQGRYKGKSSTNSQFFDAPGDEYPVFDNPSYFVVDLAAGVDFGRFSLGARVENLFDERYFNDLQEFPNFAGGLNPGEPGQIIIGTLGQTRRFIASASYEF